MKETISQVCPSVLIGGMVQLEKKSRCPQKERLGTRKRKKDKKLNSLLVTPAFIPRGFVPIDQKVQIEV